MRKQVLIKVSKKFLKKIEKLEKGKKDLERITKKEIDSVEVDERGKLSFYVDNGIYQKIKQIKIRTGQPYWRIIEMILEGNLEEEAQGISIRASRKEEIEGHIEPTECENCGSDDLLIGYGKNTWYCYDCKMGGTY